MSNTAQRRYCSHCKAAFLSNIDRCPRDGADLQKQDINPLLGKVFGGRFRLVERLGAGGMGEVYRAEHETIGKSFAVKVLLGEVAADNHMVARFHREAKALSMLSHRNVVSVTDFGETDEGLLYLVTEFIDGTPLSDEIKKGSFGAERALHIIRQIAKALAHAHRRGLVHRDLKPDNVMLVTEDDEDDLVKVLDFGIARVAEVEEDTATLNHLTSQGIVMGTPSYMAPEQACGEVVDHRADLYSLGVVLYELLAGRVPFRGQSAIELLSKHLREEPPQMNRNDVTGEFKTATLRLLEKKPENRFPDADSFLRALDSLTESSGPYRRLESQEETGPTRQLSDTMRAPLIDREEATRAHKSPRPRKALALQPDPIAPTPIAPELPPAKEEAAKPAPAPKAAADPATPATPLVEAKPAVSAGWSRSQIVVVAILGVIAAALGGLYFGRGGADKTTVQTIPAPAPPPVAAVTPPEPAVPIAAVASDAGTEVAKAPVMPPDAAPVVTEPVAPTPPPKTGGSKAKPAPTQKELQAKVERVGKRIGELSKTVDKDKIEGLRRRYLDLAMSLPDLADTPGARRGFATRLRKLSSAISKAGRQ
jgi:serine/threonine-protein kinase